MRGQAAYAGSDAAQITLHIAQQWWLLISEQMRIALLQMFEEERFRDIGELSVIDQVLHQLCTVAVERVENAVIDTVEFQRRDRKSVV